ncbi:hypothetical protein OZL92_11035 [Bacillus sonorensis]|uniref:Pre-neck appendage protein gp12 n=1 Tax=Bacillus sonorensis TaxID=119858 RepID=A0ABN5AGZ8_9BACI|nr:MULTISPECIES: peptidase G2 autoproteolytic cleavage domain-containing protein [Bacillus]TWK72957.1 hypothetical protein CHCC20335_1622 [Bacillus paralicheniformis]ASB90027.1 Pre-neck appendage protein gp12 [Bacillus sonorensis]MBG9916765.1 hypothetical protein [Bacillus sonorensis]MCY7855640.1 hypothetical protein [Bacillus sonorensis]MCY8087199.1 hypothetical protein [Bacillus sonorensis]
MSPSEGGKIRPAEKGDNLLGAILGEASFHWSGRCVKNEFGGYVYEWQKGLDGQMVLFPKENPDYLPGQDYKSRKEREEWNVVGLAGQVYVRCDEAVKAGDLIEADGGMAAKADLPGQRWQVMNITSEYDSVRSFGIARVFIRLKKQSG